MINKPSIDVLKEKADSVYTLVVLAARRAKQINEEENLLLDEEKYVNGKPVTQSLQELEADKLSYHKNTENTYK